jgi:hypothetical protein
MKSLFLSVVCISSWLSSYLPGLITSRFLWRFFSAGFKLTLTFPCKKASFWLIQDILSINYSIATAILQGSFLAFQHKEYCFLRFEGESLL